MKKLQARGVLFAVAVMLVISFVVGCTATTPKNTETASSTAANTSSSSPDSLLPYNGDPITINAFAADVGVTESFESPVYKLYKNAVGNIDIKWETVPFSDYDTKAKLYLNSGEIPDLIWVKGPEIYKNYLDSGLFLDFNEYADVMPNWTEATKTNPGLKKFQSPEGKQYMVHDLLEDAFREGFIVNKTILDKYGIPVPKTLADMEAGMQKLKEADPSITPFHARWGMNYNKEIFAASLGANLGVYYDQDSGTWKHAVLEPDSKYKDLIQLLADYYAKGYLNPEFATMSDEQTKNLVSSGKWGYLFDFVHAVQLEHYGYPAEKKLPIDIEFTKPLAADGVKPRAFPTSSSDGGEWAYLVSAKTKYPKLMAAWVDKMLSREMSAAIWWGVEGESYKVVDGKKEWIPEFQAKGSEYKTEFGILNIMGPRYIMRYDSGSRYPNEPPISAEFENAMVEAVEKGEVEVKYKKFEPLFTKEESEEISRINTAINTVIEQNEMLFVLGKRPMSEWDAYLTEVKAAGDIQKLVDIYNGAIQTPERASSKERDYVKP